MQQQNNPRFTGTGVAIVTPFLENEELDLESLSKVIRHLTDGGVEYLVVLGTTGETATLSHEEKQRVFSHVAYVNEGRLPLVAGIGGNDTARIIRDLHSFDLKGYEAILSVSPYYNKPSQEGIFQHYKRIAGESQLPIIMYNVPGRTSMNVSSDTTLRIAHECPNVIATKEASGNMEQIMRIVRDKPQSFDVISGDDALTLPIMALGATGVISVVANAYPRVFSDMVRHCIKGDYAAARANHYLLLEVIDTLFAEGSPSGVKAYLSEMGICKNQFRLPVVPVSQSMMERIQGICHSI